MKKKMQWFRMYVDVLNSAKVQILPPEMFKAWVNILCIACNNDGVLPETLHETAFLLRITVDELNPIIDELIERDLLDEQDGRYSPSNWDERQYKSDSSYERVKKYREKRKKAGLVAQNDFSKSKRAEIYNKDNNSCVYCSSSDDLTIDHKTPEMRGGSNCMTNLQTVCRKCNADKRNMTHDEYLQWEGRVTFHVTEKTQPNRTETENRDIEQKERPFVYHDVTDWWNSIAEKYKLTKIRMLSSTRKSKLKKRVNSIGDYSFFKETVEDAISNSPFLCGENKQGWKCDFDFILQESSFIKMVEGKYNGERRLTATEKRIAAFKKIRENREAEENATI